ncbi:MAG: VWA domain-containing protein [Anaerolineae bacterium]
MSRDRCKAKKRSSAAAARYVLTHLNPQDRFNAIVFSTGYRLYANELQPVSNAENAAQWINGLDAVGGTDINLALTTAAQMADSERQTVLLFLTDGLPSEGVVESKSILANIATVARPNLRLFSFGVGDDVDTFLLDSLSSAYGGTSVYVRPQENIEDKVSSLYNKITSPVLTDLQLNFGSVMVDDSYPLAPLPDLFAGSSLIVVGRYRGGDKTTITLTGKLNGETQTFSYSDLVFPANAGGQPFIPRLWATRKIGYLLNQIRLNGETKELVDSVVALSIRYGIITPYTSFLIQENDITVQEGGTPIPIEPPVAMQGTALPTATANTGSAAVDRASEANDMAGAVSAPAAPTAQAGQASGGAAAGTTTEVIKQVNDRTFVLRNGTWIDTQYTAEVAANTQIVTITFLSDDYFKLLEDHPELKDYLALGDHVIVIVDGVAYEIKP